jgi:hypothetical protein
MGQVIGFRDGDAGQLLLERIALTGAIVCEASSGPEVTYRVLGRIPLTVRVPVSAKLSEDRLTEMARRLVKSLAREANNGQRHDAGADLAAVHRLDRAKRRPWDKRAALEHALEVLHERELGKHLRVLARLHAGHLAGEAQING